MKDALVGKFLTKNDLDFITDEENRPADHGQHVRIHALINKEFDKFISDKTYTQNNLVAFENNLKLKLFGIFKEHNLKITFTAQRKTSRNLDTTLSNSIDNKQAAISSL